MYTTLRNFDVCRFLRQQLASIDNTIAIELPFETLFLMAKVNLLWVTENAIPMRRSNVYRTLNIIDSK